METLGRCWGLGDGASSHGQAPQNSLPGHSGDVLGHVLPVGHILGQEVGTGTGCLAQEGVQALDGGGFSGLAEG